MNFRIPIFICFNTNENRTPLLSAIVKARNWLWYLTLTLWCSTNPSKYSYFVEIKGFDLAWLLLVIVWRCQSSSWKNDFQSFYCCKLKLVKEWVVTSLKILFTFPDIPHRSRCYGSILPQNRVFLQILNHKINDKQW